MNALVAAFAQDTELADTLAALLGGARLAIEHRHFPDGETWLRVDDDISGHDVVLACNLHRPDEKALPLYLLAATLRDLGARRIVLAAPYLPYMRQDYRFHDGEAITARYFARWLSGFVDGLITVDPHLHRIHRLAEVYAAPATAVSAAPAIAAWLREHEPDALLIGPDAESAQWVGAIAQLADCPYTVLKKIRRSDRDVEVSLPDLQAWHHQRRPVLVDDIISTAHTMIAALAHLRDAGTLPPLCIGVHAIFAGSAYADLQAAGVRRVVTCNTIAHPSNAIDVQPLIADEVTRMLAD